MIKWIQAVGIVLGILGALAGFAWLLETFPLVILAISIFVVFLGAVVFVRGMLD